MDNIEVGDIVEVHGYSHVWDGARLLVQKVHRGGHYDGSVTGIVASGMGNIWIGVEALFSGENLRKVEPDAAEPEEAKEDPRKEKPVKAVVYVYLHRRGLSPMQYNAEFDSEQEFEEYQKSPFTDMSAEYKVNDYSWSSTKFLRLRHKYGTALIDPTDLQLLSIERHTES